tara:strand:+ start:191 stop:553 length:363 start_codon:yes stop_codon:yes gene_type:complete
MSRSSLKGSSEKTLASDKSLPWWVELLFVQIGLPDRLLPKLLKIKKKSNRFFRDNKRLILISIILLTGFSYTNPLATYYKKQNQCINSTIAELNEDLDYSNFSKVNINSIAVNYCNGGAK